MRAEAQGEGEFFSAIPTPFFPGSDDPFPHQSLTSWENICADGQGEKVENGVFAVNLKYAGNASQ